MRECQGEAGGGCARSCVAGSWRAASTRRSGSTSSSRPRRTGGPACRPRRRAGRRWSSSAAWRRVREGTRDQFRAAPSRTSSATSATRGAACGALPASRSWPPSRSRSASAPPPPMFSVVNGVLLRPLPYPEQDRLVEMVHQVPALGRGRFSPRRPSTSPIATTTARSTAIGHWDWDNSPVTVSGSGSRRRCRAWRSRTRCCRCWAREPILGRRFSARRRSAGRPPTAVIISHAYWQRTLRRRRPPSGGRWSSTAWRVRSSACCRRRSASSSIDAHIYLPAAARARGGAVPVVRRPRHRPPEGGRDARGGQRRRGAHDPDPAAAGVRPRGPGENSRFGPELST